MYPPEGKSTLGWSAFWIVLLIWYFSKICSFISLLWKTSSTLESLLTKKSFAFSRAILLSITILLVDDLMQSLKIFNEKFSSLLIKFGGWVLSEFFNTWSHCWIKFSKSSISNSSLICSASVRNNNPVLGGLIKTPRALKRLLSVSVFIFLEILTPCPYGCNIKYLPGNEILPVSLGPLFPVGSFITCTRTFCFGSRSSVIPTTPFFNLNGPRSDTWIKPFFSLSPISIKAASIPGRTFSTVPKKISPIWYWPCATINSSTWSSVSSAAIRACSAITICWDIKCFKVCFEFLKIDKK